MLAPPFHQAGWSDSAIENPVQRRVGGRVFTGKGTMSLNGRRRLGAPWPIELSSCGMCNEWSLFSIGDLFWAAACWALKLRSLVVRPFFPLSYAKAQSIRCWERLQSRIQYEMSMKKCFNSIFWSDLHILNTTHKICHNNNNTVIKSYPF